MSLLDNGEIRNNDTYPNKSICAGWGDSMFKTGAVGVGAAVGGSAGLEWRSKNSFSFLKSSFSVARRLP